MKYKSIIILLWISLATTFFFFFVFNDEKTLENFAITLLVSTMYSFVLGLGNGIINDFLNRKFPWSETTRTRAIISIVSILIANTVLVYFCNYMNFVVIQKATTTEEFFSGKYNGLRLILPCSFQLFFMQKVLWKSLENIQKRSCRAEVNCQICQCPV
jgi:hypothetical protein